MSSNTMLVRYSDIKGKFPRELLLLQGTGCVWKKCRFCDYYDDVSEEPFEINKQALDKVTGRHGILDIINSGSAMEFDEKTIELIKHKIDEKNIHTVWFEAHYIYRKGLEEFAKQFACEVKFRTGAETFDTEIRDYWNKGIPQSVSAEELANYFDGICLLVGVEGQTLDGIKRDIELADKFFEYYSVNVFNENSKELRRDEELIQHFCDEVMPELITNPKAEVLINNTDLGVG